MIDPSQIPGFNGQYPTPTQQIPQAITSTSQLNIPQLEGQANQLIQSSMSNYGVMPNPQLATESLLTGASPLVSQALAANDPTLKSALLSQPIGQSQYVQNQVPPPTSLFDNPYQFNQQIYNQYKQQLQQKGIQNSFGSMNETPMANIGWMNSILQGGSDEIKKWQSFLANQGFYVNYDQNGKSMGKGEVNGYASPQFTDAFHQWMLAYFLPQAVLSRDQNEMTHATQMLSALGYDTSSIAASMANDPKKREQMIDAWLQAQGPDGNKIHALDQFANQFGSAALPDQLNKLRGDGAFASIGDFVHHFIPFIGSSDEDKLKALTPAEQEIIAPSLQKAHDQNGFFTFLGDVFSAPSKALVTAGMFFGDAVHGQVENPFDSTVQSRVQNFVNNPMQEMFGKDFVKNNPWLATIGNVAASFLDDPITYVPFMGSAKLAETLGAATEAATAEGATTESIAAAGRDLMTPVEKATGGLISHRAGTLRMEQLFKPTTVIKGIKNNGLKETLAKAFDPVGNAQRDVANLFTNQNIDHDIARGILGDFSSESTDKIEQLIQMGKGPDGQAKVLAYLRDPSNKYAHRLLDTSTLLNRHEYDKVLRNFQSLDDGKKLHIWNMMHMNDSSRVVDLDQTHNAITAYRDAATAAGVDPEKINQFANAFWKTGVGDPTRKGMADQMVKEIEQAKSPQWVNSFKQRMEEGRGRISIKPKAKTPVSAVANEYAQSMGIKNQAMKDQLDRFAEETFGEANDSTRSEALKDPYMQEVLTGHQSWMDDMQQKLDAVMKGEAPNEAHLPYTASDIMVHDSKVLKGSEFINRKLGIDKAMNLWKTGVLSKPATAIRSLFADESQRFHVDLMLNDMPTWLKYMKSIGMRKDGDEVLRIVGEHPEINARWASLATNGTNYAGAMDLEAGASGYRQSLTNLVENYYSKNEWSKGWVDTVSKARNMETAGKKYLTKFLKSRSPEAQQMRDQFGIDLKKPGPTQTTLFGQPTSKVDELVAKMQYEMTSLIHSNPNGHMVEWIKNGKVDQKKLKEIEKGIGSHYETADLPRVQAVPKTSMHVPGASYAERYHNKVASMFTKSRARGVLFKSLSNFKQLKKVYTDESGIQRFSDTELRKMAEQDAAQWAIKHTYQGTRSAVGSAVRSIAPFWAATANANRFYLHTFMEHPELALPAMQAETGLTEQQANGTGGLTFNVPLLGDMLSKAGLHSGDQFSVQPMNAFFFTREGLGGIFPGTGPVFNTALGALPSDWQDSLSQIPGLQYAKGGTPALPWLEQLISGEQLAVGNQGMQGIPFVGRSPGYYDKKTDEKLQQMEADWEQGGRQGEPPSIQDAKNDLAKELTITGAGSFVSPVGLTAQDERKQAITKAEQTWSSGLSPQDKETFYQQNPEIADYFKYTDPSTPLEPTKGKDSKADILKRSPWVLAYTTGVSTPTVPGRATLADTQQQYQRDIQEGDIRVLDPQEYIQKMRTKEENEQAYNQFGQLQAQLQNFLQSTGLSSTSAQAQSWKKQNYDPYIDQLVSEYPDWGNTFVKQTSKSQEGLEYSSKPFYSVSTFDVLPQNPALETQTTALWRAALVRRDQAVSALSQIVSAGGSQFEKDMVLQGLVDQLSQLSQMDPTFQSQLSQYRYSKLSDLLTYQSTQQSYAAQGYPITGAMT